MAETAHALEAFLARHGRACALVEVIEARGSTPREAGSWMLVAPGATFGTIGGGQLEWMAIDEAQRVLRQVSDGSRVGASPPLRLGLTPEPPLPPAGGGGRRRRVERASAQTGKSSLGLVALDAVLDIPLGPEIGQCCGGRVKLGIRRVDGALRAGLVSEARAAEAEMPDVLLFGGGHVGHALAAALALLPLRVTVVETRADALDGLPAGVGVRLMAVPEEAVRAARPGSGFVILTHDHALDFVLAAEALKREDALYVGMIGSKTKHATFRRWFREEAGGTERQFARLVCPIGGNGVRDKRPAVIAALSAAEIVAALSGATVARDAVGAGVDR